MFFTLSKILGFFLKAYNLIFFSILIYILLSKSRLYFLRMMSYFFGFLALFVIIIGGFSYIPNYLIWKFENFIEIQKPINPDGIILLGGAFVGSKKAFDLNQVSLGGRAERVVETLRLLNEHKEAKLLFVSNASMLVNSGISEAEQAKQFFEIFQINDQRLIIKEISNNTYQESIEIANHLREKGGKWIIVTSALHMPRTIALMQSRDLGNSIIFPYPTDFTSFNPKFNLKFSFNNIGRLDNLIHEIIGLLAYRVTGRTKIFFPDLNLIPVNFN